MYEFELSDPLISFEIEFPSGIPRTQGDVLNCLTGLKDIRKTK